MDQGRGQCKGANTEGRVTKNKNRRIFIFSLDNRHFLNFRTHIEMTKNKENIDASTHHPVLGVNCREGAWLSDVGGVAQHGRVSR